MREQKTRLDFSLGKDMTVATDTSSGESTIWSKGHFTAYNVDYKVIVQHIEELQHALATCVRRKKTLLLRYIEDDADIAIQEIIDGKWQFISKGVVVLLENGVLYPANALDINQLQQKLARCQHIMSTAEAILTPETDIVRRISDIGMLAWKYMSHSLTHIAGDFENGIISHAFVDYKHYENVSIEIGVEETTVSSAGKEIFTIPTDDSIRFFYGAS